MHVLSSGFHRIRYSGLVTNRGHRDNLARARELLHAAPGAAAAPNGADAPPESIQQPSSARTVVRR
ncbi:hypothetical protein [Sulfuriferula plumbiphila]|uniref:hypothetical protein n=1 Tax=Sulfuriferula plumbiphila TaxID=171865 RepID=UPI00138726C3|nr:hypothetical protein [Sulfuriferula plumbiphila]